MKVTAVFAGCAQPAVHVTENAAWCSPLARMIAPVADPLRRWLRSDAPLPQLLSFVALDVRRD